MSFLNNNYYIKLKSGSRQQKQALVFKVLKDAIEQNDSKNAIAIFDKFKFEELSLSYSTYKKYLKVLEQVILKENDIVGYIDGIATLKKCYAQIDTRVSTRALENAMSKEAYRLENNKAGYKLWMKEAYNCGAISRVKYNKLISPVAMEQLEESLQN